MDKRQYIITGYKRSGTTLMAKLLNACGVHILRKDDASWEFPQMNDAGVDSKQLQQIVDFYSKKYTNWGFKVPNYIDRQDIKFSNPYVIFMLRNPSEIEDSEFRRSGITISQDYISSEQIYVIEKLAKRYQERFKIIRYEMALNAPMNALAKAGLAYQWTFHTSDVQKVMDDYKDLGGTKPEYV